MIVDLSKAVYVASIDTRRWRTLDIQCAPAEGEATTAVVEVFRAFDENPNTPRVSFGSPVTLTLDGSAIDEVDVTDAGWVHVVVTTAQAGVSVDMEIRQRGGMSGETLVTRAKTDSTGVVNAPLSVQDAMKAFVLAHPDSSNTSAIEIKHALRADMAPISFSPAASLTIDGSTVTEIDTDSTGYLWPFVGTAQANHSVDLYWYVRNASCCAEDNASISSEPASQPSDGDMFRSEDGETMSFDSTRGDWLGELRSLTVYAPGTAIVGSMNLQIGSLSLTTPGIYISAPITIVGIELFSLLDFTGDIDWMDNGTKVATVASTTTKTVSSNALNIKIPSSSTPQYPRINNITSGTASSPIVRLFYRRRYT